MDRLLRTGDYSDLILVLGGETRKVHKAILYSQSEFFKNACKVSFKEGETGVITLYDDDPELLRLMLSYCYGTEYVAYSYDQLCVSDHIRL